MLREHKTKELPASERSDAGANDSQAEVSKTDSQQENTPASPIVSSNSSENTTELQTKLHPKRPIRRVSTLDPPPLRKKYGKLPLLPGESEEDGWKLWDSLVESRGYRDPFEAYIAKEITDELLLIRRYRTALSALLNVHIEDPRRAPIAGQSDPDPAQAHLPSPTTMLESVPLLPDEEEAIQNWWGLNPEVATALSVLQTYDLRRELSARIEAAERRYYDGLKLLDTLRERRAQLAAMNTSVDFVKARTKHDLRTVRKKPEVPWHNITDRPEHVPQKPVLVEYTGFTDLGRSMLGPPPILHGESEEAYARLFLALRDYFGSTELIDNFLINDAASATWEKRRLRQAAETIFCQLLKIKTKKPFAESDVTIKKEEFAALNEKSLNDALENSGIDVGYASALTFGQLSKVLGILEDEIASLEYRRRKALNTLVISRARRVKTGFYNARQTEVRREHEWHAHKAACEFNRKYERYT